MLQSLLPVTEISLSTSPFLMNINGRGSEEPASPHGLPTVGVRRLLYLPRGSVSKERLSSFTFCKVLNMLFQTPALLCRLLEDRDSAPHPRPRAVLSVSGVPGFHAQLGQAHSTCLSLSFLTFIMG